VDDVTRNRENAIEKSSEAKANGGLLTHKVLGMAVESGPMTSHGTVIPSATLMEVLKKHNLPYESDKFSVSYRLVFLIAVVFLIPILFVFTIYRRFRHRTV